MSRAEQVEAVEHQLVVEQVLDAHSRRPGSVYNRVLEAVPGERHPWDMDVTIYPLLWGRFRLCVGPAGKDDDGGFDWKRDIDTWDEALAAAEAVTRRDAQRIRLHS